MVAKETLHLGQTVFYGEKMERAVVDALTQTGIGLCVEDGRYVLTGYDEIYE